MKRRYCSKLIAMLLIFVIALQLVSCAVGKKLNAQVNTQVNAQSQMHDSESQTNEAGPKISISKLVPASNGYSIDTESYQLVQAVGVHEAVNYKELYMLSKHTDLLQDSNAYEIQEISVLYIDPALVEEYLTSNESMEKFFGFSVQDLQEEYGNVALTFSDNGSVEKGVTIFPVEESSASDPYDYKSFFKKLAVGCGILVVGATLSVATGGTFTCAMVAISKAGLGSALIAGATTSAYYTAKGISQGKSVTEAFENSCAVGLNSFADGFVVGCVIGSVYSVSHPVCFVAGTPIITANGSVPIEKLQVGDIVLTRNMKTGTAEQQTVLNTFISQTRELITLKFSNQDMPIVCTPSHPFYSPVKGWTEAIRLRAGDILVTLNGEYAVLEQVQHDLLESPLVCVYNIETESNHNYYVGEGDNAVLVHNKCEVGQFDTYGELGKLAEKGDGIEGHHIPSKEFMKQYGVSANDAMAINISHSQHVKTFTYGYSAQRQQYYMALSPNDALRVDISNMRSIFREEGTLDEMLPVLNDYVKTLKTRFPELFW